jgi:hypothetical protein
MIDPRRIDSIVWPKDIKPDEAKRIWEAYKAELKKEPRLLLRDFVKFLD